MLPEDVTACAVTASTVKGRYSVEAAADDLQFTISVDGNKMDGSTVSDIESGSEVEIHAFPTRGKLLDSWIINGESVEPKDNTYTTTITGNLSVSATTKQDEALSYTLKTDGGGTARYTITDKNGDKQDGTFQGDNTPALTVYKGKSIVFETADTDNTITALLVNGEQQELDDGTYTIENASEGQLPTT
jgi:hypothetical protein